MSFAHRERQLLLQREVGDEFALEEEERPLQGHDGFRSSGFRRRDGSLELFRFRNRLCLHRNAQSLCSALGHRQQELVLGVGRARKHNQLDH
jgi:hypothetical protein